MRGARGDPKPRTGDLRRLRVGIPDSPRGGRMTPFVDRPPWAFAHMAGLGSNIEGALPATCGEVDTPRLAISARPLDTAWAPIGRPGVPIAMRAEAALPGKAAFVLRGNPVNEGKGGRMIPGGIIGLILLIILIVLLLRVI